MAEAITIARPYANAIFSIAQDKGELKAWSDLLMVLAQCASEPEMQSIITSPAVSDEQAVDLLADIAGDKMTADARNFLLMLAENNRLLLMADITVLFEELRAEAEKSMTAEVISARALDDAQAAKISAALKQRLGRDVTLTNTIDESLLGGAIIRAGDLVIDGSALGKLNRLATAII
ncbi:MAG TPA: F0F1 ATP synthase subunit delta [Methylophaga aminisulfidivorans]|uniref:ATP synthase subunit delta n=2 Tax=root TaxID=1 RepID=A0A7C1ZQ59_9GAMM|nr:F0F1 ATP synthase subunit delta [Methylophaga aminisulfidivorans]